MVVAKSNTSQNQCAPCIGCAIIAIVIGVVFFSTGMFDMSDPTFPILFIAIFIVIMAAACSSSQAAKKRQALTEQATSTLQPEPRPQTQQYNQPQAQPQPHVIEKEKIIIKEIVKIKCSYCGALVESTARFCENCGANM